MTTTNFTEHLPRPQEGSLSQSVGEDPKGTGQAVQHGETWYQSPTDMATGQEAHRTLSALSSGKEALGTLGPKAGG